MHFSIIFDNFRRFFSFPTLILTRFRRSKVGRKLHSQPKNVRRRMTADFFFSGAITVLGYSKYHDLVHFQFWSLFFRIFQFFRNFYNFLKKGDFYINFYKNQIFSSFSLKFNDFYSNLAQIPVILLIFSYFCLI
jgi:hypothetical protein